MSQLFMVQTDFKMEYADKLCDTHVPVNVPSTGTIGLRSGVLVIYQWSFFVESESIDIFISYQWGNQETIIKIADKLKVSITIYDCIHLLSLGVRVDHYLLGGGRHEQF